MKSFRLKYWGSAVIGGVSVYGAIGCGGISAFTILCKIGGIKANGADLPPLSVSLPLFAFLSFMTAWMLRYRRRLRRARAGQCVSCGYDLRASGERCPECGAPVASIN